MMRRPLFALVLTLVALPLHARQGAAPGPPPIEVEAPAVGIAGLAVTLKITTTAETAAFPLRLLDADGELLARATTEPCRESELTFTMPASGAGLQLYAAGYARPVELSIRPIPGWFTLLPPILAILFALLFRQVVPALAAGVWIGAAIVHGGPLIGGARLIDIYVIGTLSDGDHVSIVIFSLLLGGMIGIISRSGGTIGLVEVLSRGATSRRRGQMVTWFMGLAVFFDDYANTLLVGNTMRPVTDRLKISREKLAYIVDSTAAPVAAIALISTWIGYEVSLIGDALVSIGSDLDAYAVFIRAIPYNFYPVLALAFGLYVASSGRDFGPMLAAERRAAGGKLLSDTAAPLADFDSDALMPPEGRPRRWYNAVLPVVAVLIVTFLGLWFTGRASLAADGTTPPGGLEGIGAVFGAGASYRCLLWASATGCLVAVLLAKAQRVLSVTESIVAWTNGMRSLTLAMVILTLAWAISDVCRDLGTASFLVAAISDAIDPRWLPCIVFVLSALTAFATGTSWTTMGILIPLAVPTAHGVSSAAGIDAGLATAILLASVSSVLAGAIFGDHCSPISDTTVLSSMASGCDHVDHVRTQLPYALMVGGVATVFGYLPAGFGLSPFISIFVSLLVLAAALAWLGQRSQAR